MDRNTLRHFVATLAYRLKNALEDSPSDFESFSIAENSRTPLEILHHMCEIIDYSCAYFEGEFKRLPKLDWKAEIERFKTLLIRCDKLLVDQDTKSEMTLEALLQGPLSDAMTHVGQLAMLRRLAGSPVKRERFFLVDIQAGRIDL